MPPKSPLELVKPTEYGPKPPYNLGVAGRSLWDRVQSEYNLSDVGGIEMLSQACLAVDRLTSLCEAIERDGPIIYTKAGPREHPGLKAELQCRAFVVRTLARLGLNYEAIRAAPGRPGGWA